MVKKYTSVILFVVSTVIFFVTNVFASGLSDLITTLYGGKGIPVTRVFETVTGDETEKVQVPIDSLNEIHNLNLVLNTERGDLPVSSTGGGFTFQYDSELEVFTRTTDSLGPIFAERAPTLGKGKLNLGFSYTYINFTTLEGRDLDDLESIVILDKKQKDKNLLQLDFDVNIKSNLFSFYGTYGITDHWDISILVPVLQTQLDVDSTAKILNRKSKKIDGGRRSYRLGSGDTMSDSVSGAATGLGDIFLRSKYNLFTSEWVDFTAALDINLPTGDEDELLGTGRTSIQPFLVFSKSINHFTPHLNLGYDFNSGEEGQDRFVYTAGTDYAFGRGNNHFSIALDIIGRHKIEKADIGNDIVDFSTGFKWSPRSGMLVFFNIQTPLNDEGLRADWIPTVGYELNF